MKRLCQITRACIVLAALALLATACGGGGGLGGDKDYVCTSCVGAPEADPADDGKRSGVYKGVVADVDESRTLSGVLRAVIVEGRAPGGCTITMDDAPFDSSSMSIDPAPGGDLNGNGIADPDEDALVTFTGDRFELALTISRTGEVLDAELVWDGESARVIVVKEESDALVECFEGRWEGSVLMMGKRDQIEGVWNFTIKSSEVVGTYDSDLFGGNGDLFGGSGNYDGPYENGELTVYETSDRDYLAEGTRTNDFVGGKWEKADSNAEGKWAGYRKQ